MRFTQVFVPAAAMISTTLAQTPLAQTPLAQTPTAQTPTPAVDDAYIYTRVFPDKYAFYCPEPTRFLHKNVTYIATAPEEITVTNCPCTVTYTGTPPVIPPPVETKIENGQETVITNPVVAPTNPPEPPSTAPPIVHSLPANGIPVPPKAAPPAANPPSTKSSGEPVAVQSVAGASRSLISATALALAGVATMFLFY